MDFLNGSIATSGWFIPIGILLLSLSAGLIVLMFNFENKATSALVGILLVTCNSVASMSLYYGTSYFSCCFFLAVLAAYLVKKYRFGWIASIVILTISLGGYQPYIAAAASLFVLDCLIDTLFRKKDMKHIWQSGIKYIGVLLASGILYYLILKFLMKFNLAVLGTYQNIDTLAANPLPSSILAFVHILWDAFKDVLSYMLGKQPLPYAWLPWMYVLNALFILILTVLIAFKNKLYSEPHRCIVAIILLFICFPLAVNAVAVLTQSLEAHWITKYPFIFIFIMPVILGDQFSIYVATDINAKLKKVYRSVLQITFSLLILISVNWAMLDAECYQKMILVDQQINAKALCLMDSIYTNENYSPNIQIAFIGDSPYPLFDDGKAYTSSPQLMRQASGTTGFFRADSLVHHSYILEQYLNLRLAANLNFVHSEDNYAMYEGRLPDMGVYPSNDSIYFTDDILFIKLSE